MANMKYNGGDYLPASKTFADVGEPNDPRSSQIRRRPPQTTRQFPVDEIVDDVYHTEEMLPVQRRTGKDSMNTDYARRPYYRHSTYTDPQIDQNRIETQPSRTLQKRGFRIEKVLIYAGATLAIMVGGVWVWIAGVMPVVEHWHTGDSPVRSYPIKINNKPCDVQAAYLSDKVVVTVIPQDINAHPQVFEMHVKLNTPGPHIVTVQPSYDASGNPDMQTYVDGMAGPTIVNTSSGPKMQ